MGELVLAYRYAKALYELALEEGVDKKIAEDLYSLEKAISHIPEWIKILDDTTLSQVVKDKMISQVAKSVNIHSLVAKMIMMLSSKGRAYLLPSVLEVYREEMLAAEGIVEAQVIVAEEAVWENLKNDVEKTVHNLSGRKPLLHHRVDPKIIGGMIIKINDKVYDGSVRGELQRVKEKLLKGSGEIFRR